MACRTCLFCCSFVHQRQADASNNSKNWNQRWRSTRYIQIEPQRWNLEGIVSEQMNLFSPAFFIDPYYIIGYSSSIWSDKKSCIGTSVEQIRQRFQYWLERCGVQSPRHTAVFGTSCSISIGWCFWWNSRNLLVGQKHYITFVFFKIKTWLFCSYGGLPWGLDEQANLFVRTFKSSLSSSQQQAYRRKYKDAAKQMRDDASMYKYPLDGAFRVLKKWNN